VVEISNGLDEPLRDGKEALSWTSLHTCPVCLGVDLCEDIQQGFISVGLFPHGKLGEYSAYTAYLKGSDGLTALIHERNNWEKFDNWVCSNSSAWKDCIVSTAVKSSHLYRTEGSAAFLHGLGGDRSFVKPLTACATKDLLTTFREAFDTNSDGKLTQEEKVMMFTTISVMPTVAMYRIANQVGLKAVPRYIGGCGRVSIVEGDLEPLTNFLDKDWTYRANLASQILGLVDTLLTGEWVLMGWSLDWDTFSVTKMGQVVISNLGQFTPIHKSLISRSDGETREVCNEDCFYKYKATVLNFTPRGQPSKGCRDALFYGDMMYYQICRNILAAGETRRGLAEELADLVAECVEERGKGERWRTVEEIRERLSPTTIIGEEEKLERDMTDQNEEDATTVSMEEDEEDQEEENDDNNDESMDEDNLEDEGGENTDTDDNDEDNDTNEDDVDENEQQSKSDNDDTDDDDDTDEEGEGSNIDDN